MAAKSLQSGFFRSHFSRLGLAATCLTLATSLAHGAPVCQLNQAQALFVPPAPPNSAILHLLDICEAAGSQDYRIPLLRGVIARQQGQWDKAAALLETAHQRAPLQPAPTLELALTQEWRGQYQAASSLYAAVLKQNPQSRPALLGLARVERAEYHFSNAESIYHQLLQANPHDADARNGLAWIALANKHIGPARSTFSDVLTEEPDNAEAKNGLVQTSEVWRYQLDLTGGMTHTVAGTAGTGSADLQMALDAFNTIEVGDVYNSDELRLTQIARQAQLPTEDVRLGYYYKVPNGENFSVTYDYRDHAGLPSEQWISSSAGNYFGNGFQWFVGGRAAFGAPQWNNLFLESGIIAPLTQNWQAGLTGYFDSAYFAHGGRNTTIQGNSYAFAADVYRQGIGNSFFNAGIGYDPDISNFEVHARIILPVTQNTAFLVSIEHDSVNHEYQASVGWRFYWQ